MDINLPTIILQVLGLWGLMVLLKKSLYQPLLDLVDERARQANATIDSAEKRFAESDEVLAAAKQVLQVARTEAVEIRSQARSSATQEKEQMITHARKEAENVIKAAQEEIEHQSHEAEAKIRHFVAGLSMQISEKLLMREINQEDRKRYLNLYNKEIQKVKV